MICNFVFVLDLTEAHAVIKEKEIVKELKQELIRKLNNLRVMDWHLNNEEKGSFFTYVLINGLICNYD
jgi:hypothetical protein